VFGPIFAAPVFVGQVFSRSGDHSEWRIRHCRSDQWRDNGSPGWHVFGDGGRLALERGSDVGGDALAKVEDLDRPGCAERAPSARRREPDPDLLPQQAVRGRVVMLVDLDVPVFN